MTDGSGKLDAMTDAGWPDQLEIAFDPDELHRERMTALRSTRIAAWGWLVLAALASALLLMPLVRSEIDRLWPLTAIWAVLIAGMLWTSARGFRALARCSVWRDGEQPKYALRLSSDGLWVAGATTYDWPSVHSLRTRTIFGRSYLSVRLKAGVRPDAPIVAGLGELCPSDGRRLPLTPRGPRLLIKTLQLDNADIARAVRHYSNNRR